MLWIEIISCANDKIFACELKQYILEHPFGTIYFASSENPE
jgi:hypothetical protein